MTGLRDGLAYFAIVFAAGFLFGVIRAVFLTPHLGALPAVLVELPFILALAWWACGRILDRRRVPARLADRALMGGSAFTLLILAEAALAAGLQGQTIAEFMAGWQEPAGAAGLAGQIVFAVLPLIRTNRTSI